MFEDNFEMRIFAVILMVVLVSVFVWGIFYTQSAEIIVATLETTFVDDGFTYFVFKEENKEPEVFENTDALFFAKFNSADFVARLNIGETYKLKVVGWRIPLFSCFRNIIEFQLIQQD